MKKARWLPRTLFFSPAYLGFCTNKKQFERELKACGLQPHEYYDFHKATAHLTTIRNQKGQFICILCLDIASKEYQQASINQVMGLIAHEVTHIKQRIMEDIGEAHPSLEFEAYVMQQLMQYYCTAYMELQAG
jgi:hypothetical protein